MNNFIFQGNYIDLIIIVVLVYFISEAWRYGFWIILADFGGFLISLMVALTGYQFASSILRDSFELSNSLSNALGFLLVAGLTEAFVGFLLTGFIKQIPYKFWKKPWNNIAAVIPALGQGLVLTSFIFTLVIGLPIAPSVKADITDAKIGGYLVRQTTGLEAKVNDIFGGLVEDSLTYLTVQPESRESFPINVSIGKLTVDEKSEEATLTLINQERIKNGVYQLSARDELIPVARAHARDMWERKYFGHYSPEGKNVVDRLAEADISYTYAGENLALAPTLATAHQGLMNSEGHRANILDPDFKKVGIGVIDNGIYGKMFVQIFTD
jgi:uncharacterized protein YkwD